MTDDLNIYRINQSRKTPEITILPPFTSLRQKRKKYKEKEEEKKRDSFREKFFDKFKLDEDKFSINLIKKDDEWFIEIYNKKTKEKFYQSYATVCNILDISCKLPKIIGANVDEKA